MIPDSDWQNAVIPTWRLLLLRMIHPRSWFVRTRSGRVYVIRNPPPE